MLRQNSKAFGSLGIDLRQKREGLSKGRTGEKEVKRADKDIYS